MRRRFVLLPWLACQAALVVAESGCSGDTSLPTTPTFSAARYVRGRSRRRDRGAGRPDARGRPRVAAG